MIKESVTIEEIIQFLNKCLKLSPYTMQQLVENRVVCNESMVNHVQTSETIILGNKFYMVGLLGILNGLLGTDEEGWGPIAANYELKCPNGCEIPNGKIVDDMCDVCKTEKIILGKIIEFIRTPKTAR